MWNDPEVIERTTFLVDSFRRYLGRELIHSTNPETDARVLFEDPRVVLSHGLGRDPILNYGNRQALKVLGVDWTELTVMPSRLTTARDDQAERQRILDKVERLGFIEGYTGIRVTAKGERFRIHDVAIWKVVGSYEERVGLAATIPHWTFL